MRAEPSTTPLGSRTEDELVAAARKGSVEAVEELFARHWEQVRRLARTIVGDSGLADDVAQEAMIQAFSRLRTFRNDARFQTWLHRIVMNRALNALRAQRKSEGLERAEEVEATPGPTSDPSVIRAVHSLPLKHRIVVLLRFGLDLTPTEISQLTATSVGTVNSRLSRALQRLRADLEAHDV